MKNLLISGWIGSENMGDEAILASYVSRLKPLGYKITAFSINESKTKELHKIETAPFDIYKEPKRFLSAIKKCDLMVIGGGGIIQDQTSVFNTPRYLYKAVLARLYKKQVIFCGIGAGPVNFRFTKFLIRRIMNKADEITVRDEESKRVLVDAGVNPNLIIVAFDPVISLAPIERSDIQKIKDYEFSNYKCKKIISVSLRHWFDTNPYIPVSLAQKLGFRQKNGERKYELLIDKVADTINELAKREDTLFVFTPFWYTRDGKVHQDIIARLSPTVKYHELKKEYSPQELMGIFTLFDVVIAMRLHASIYAATLTKPFVALSYSSKINNFLDELGLKENRLDIETFTKTELLEKIDELPSEKNFISLYASKIAVAKKMENKNLESIKRKTLNSVK